MADPTNQQNVAAPEVQALLDQGYQAAQDGDYETAAEAFETAIEADPTNARARYNLALAQQNLGDLEGAVATYLRAIQLDPTLIEAYINLGHLYGELGLDEESLETFQRAIELDPGNDELFVALGDICREIGFYEDAIQAYRQAEILNPAMCVSVSTSRPSASANWSIIWMPTPAIPTAMPKSSGHIWRRGATAMPRPRPSR
jgi:tetratricopeptide (TPR) repeat protein